MPPPDQDLTVIERTTREPLARIVDADGSHRDSRLGPEVFGDLIAQEIGVGLLLGGLLLVPDDNPDRARYSRARFRLTLLSPASSRAQDRRWSHCDRRGFEKIAPAIVHFHGSGSV